MWEWVKREWGQLSTKAGSGLLLVAGAVAKTPEGLAQFDPRIAWGIAIAGAVLVIWRGKADGAQ